MRDKVYYAGMDVIPWTGIYTGTVMKESWEEFCYVHICFQPAFQNFSPEELRLKERIRLTKTTWFE